MAYEFYLGLDLSGQRGRLALVEKAARDPDALPDYYVRRLEHLEAGSSGEEVASHVQDLMADRSYTGRSMVVVDKSGERGRAVLRELVELGLTPIGVTVTEGDTAAQTGSGLAAPGGKTEEAAGFFVSRRALIGSIRELYRSGQIKLEEDTRESTALAEELHAEEAEAAESPFALSTALACWFAEQHTFDPMEHLSGPPPPTGEAGRRPA